MNAPQESLLQELLEEIKSEGLHFASALLAKLAGHVSDSVVHTDGGGGQTCPKGQSWSESLKKCVDDPA